MKHNWRQRSKRKFTKYRRRFFRKAGNLAPKMIFLNGELYIILKLRNLKLERAVSIIGKICF